MTMESERQAVEYMAHCAGNDIRGRLLRYLQYVDSLERTLEIESARAVESEGLRDALVRARKKYDELGEEIDMLRETRAQLMQEGDRLRRVCQTADQTIARLKQEVVDGEELVRRARNCYETAAAEANQLRARLDAAKTKPQGCCQRDCLGHAGKMCQSCAEPGSKPSAMELLDMKWDEVQGQLEAQQKELTEIRNILDESGLDKNDKSVGPLSARMRRLVNIVVGWKNAAVRDGSEICEAWRALGHIGIPFEVKDQTLNKAIEAVLVQKGAELDAECVRENAARAACDSTNAILALKEKALGIAIDTAKRLQTANDNLRKVIEDQKRLLADRQETITIAHAQVGRFCQEFMDAEAVLRQHGEEGAEMKSLWERIQTVLENKDKTASDKMQGFVRDRDEARDRAEEFSVALQQAQTELAKAQATSRDVKGYLVRLCDVLDCRFPDRDKSRSLCEQFSTAFRELQDEVDRFRARLQIDPGGSDKIDELEAAINFNRHAAQDKIEQLKVDLVSERAARKETELILEAQDRQLNRINEVLNENLPDRDKSPSLVGQIKDVLGERHEFKTEISAIRYTIERLRGQALPDCRPLESLIAKWVQGLVKQNEDSVDRIKGLERGLAIARDEVVNLMTQLKEANKSLDVLAESSLRKSLANMTAEHFRITHLLNEVDPGRDTHLFLAEQIRDVVQKTRNDLDMALDAFGALVGTKFKGGGSLKDWLRRRVTETLEQRGYDLANQAQLQTMLRVAVSDNERGLSPFEQLRGILYQLHIARVINTSIESCLQRFTGKSKPANMELDKWVEEQIREMSGWNLAKETKA